MRFGPVGTRIQICGTSASGKSTLAKALAARLDVPHIELDAIHNGPNWVATPTEVFRERVAERTLGDGWVVDGTYLKARDILWQRAETVIWLDYPLPVILWRLTRRTFRRGLLREELWNGNRESLFRHLFVPKDSLYWWILSTYRRRRRECDELFADPEHGHLKRIRLYHPREAEDLLREIPARLRPP